jgi:DNA-binding winged helix-turn-helix (wHTH) protein/TolB-like protein
MATGPRHVYRFGAFRLDATDRLLYRDGELVALPPKVLDTLLLLATNHDRVLGKDEMMKHLWPETFVEEGTLTQYIFLLRKALGDSASWIENHPRRGYRFAAPVEEHQDEIARLPIEEPPPAPRPAEGKGIQVRGLTRLRLIVVGLALVAAVAAAALLRIDRKPSTGASFHSVAVLPFRTVGDSENDYLADGVTDALITKLASLRGLRVVSYSRVRRFKNSAEEAAQIGRQLGVEAVIEGTVRVRAGQMRLSVHAIDTRTANTLWADDGFEASSTALPSLEKQVAQAIALRLKGHVTSPERDLITKSGPGNAEAYDLILRARAALKRADMGEGAEPAVRMLERAAQIDPMSADAHGWLAFALSDVAAKAPEGLRAAISHANLALSADPNSLIAIRALAKIQHATGRQVEGLLLAKRALDTNPDDLDAIAAAAHAYFRTGLNDRAIALYEKALKWEPENHEFRAQLVRIYYFSGEYKKGINVLSERPLSDTGTFGTTFGLFMYVETGELAKAIEIVRNERKYNAHPEAHGFAVYSRGAVLEAAGDLAGARQIWAEFVRRQAPRTAEKLPATLYGSSLAYAKLGDRENAMDCVRRLLAGDPGHPVKLFFASEAHALLGNRREALDSLKAAVANGFLNLPMIEGMARSRVCTLYSLRNDPEFLAIRAELARRLDELRARY